MPPLTVEEALQHPEFPHVVWPLVPDKKGRVAVAAGRGGPFELAYEIHGRGNRHVLWIMGLGGAKWAWQRQTYDFGHLKSSQFTSLIFDNRGIGESDKPLLRYTTSEMAKDVLELLDHVGWTGKREVHVVGISMGGMIAMELASLIPERICTLALVSTAAELFRTTGFLANLASRLTLFLPSSPEAQLARLKHNLYTMTWLSAPDDSVPPTTHLSPSLSSTSSTLTSSQAITSEPRKPTRFPTNGDRAAATELHKRQSPTHFPRLPFLAQAAAANWHSLSPSRLLTLSLAIGKKRILVVHGTHDRMIAFPHGVVLWRGLEKGEGRTRAEEWAGVEEEKDVWEEGEVGKRFVREGAHVLPVEMREEFGGWVEELVERGARLNEEEGVEMRK